jgi:WD40 repeat protein/transcriptional regulator with XRE-family HTH domain
MHRYSYRERDYAFGQRILTLRTQIGLTQTGLAELLHLTKRAVGEWEGGLSYPKPEHLKALIALAVQHGAFPAGQEAEEIRALWKASHQKMLLDERWLAELVLSMQSPIMVPLSPPMAEEGRPNEHTPLSSAARPRLDWSGAPSVSSFYGREAELARLHAWIVEERCRVVNVLGSGGIGKSSLAVKVMQQVAQDFQVVLWRSLRDATPPEALLADCLQVLAPEPLVEVPRSLEARLRLLLDSMREERVLLVFDNLESVLEEREATGRMRTGYEGYARLLQEVGQSQHQSCLLLTSREKPAELVALEGSRLPVRSLRLTGLDAAVGARLLAEKDVADMPAERERLIERYGGNPLALKIVAQTIVDLFDGEVAPFLEQGEVVFGGVRQLLAEQFERLSPLEQMALRWLAILREPVTLDDLVARLSTPLSRIQMLEVVEALRRRSLLERGQQPGSFTLHSVVLEFATEQLIAEMVREVEDGRLARLIEYGLELATAKEYVRQTQQRLLVASLLAQLRSRYQGREEMESRLLALLTQLRERADYAQGYGPANVLALLRLERGHLRGLDLSQLAIRGASLQSVELQGTSLSGALLQECVLTQSFDAITAVAVSPSGQYWAAASRRGEVRLWREEGRRLQSVWHAHTDVVLSLDFSPDEHLLASGSYDGSLKLWDVESGALLWSSWQTEGIRCLAFARDGSLLASGGLDATIRLWDPKSGTLFEEVLHPGPVYALAWSPNGHLLASSGFADTIRLWEIGHSEPATCVQTLSGHSSWVRGLTFAPDGRTLASASSDGTVKLWEVSSGRSLETLVGHRQRVDCVVWSPDGRTLASSGMDRTIWLWDVQSRSSRAVLHGHTTFVRGLAFTPDSRHLLSGSEDGTLRLWDVERDEALLVLQGYATALYDLDWSPDGTKIASASFENGVSLWLVDGRAGGMLLRELVGHTWSVYGVAWSPDGGVLASSGLDNAIRLWDPDTGSSLQVTGDLDHPDTLFWGVAWSPDGKLLASATVRRGVLLWEVEASSGRWIGRELSLWIRRLTFSPDGNLLLAGAEDGDLYMWDVSDGRLLQRLPGNHGAAMSVAWSPDGTRLASVGMSRGGGELLVWDAQTGARLYHLHEPSASLYALAWTPDGAGLVSGGSDGRLIWWDLRHGVRVRVRKAHEGTVQALKLSPDGTRLASCGDDGAIRLWDLDSGEPLGILRRDRPYERLNITGIRGLTQAEIATLRALGAVEDGRAAPW